MDSVQSKFATETEHVKDEVRKFEDNMGINSNELESELSESVVIKMTPEANQKRITELKQKIEDDTINDSEMEEYGWRILNQN